MNCLKCGKETSGTQVFCEDCLQIMQHYPVKPGTAIHLPRRDTTSQEKKQHDRSREPSKEDALLQLRRMTHFLTAIIAVLSVLLLLTASMLIHTLEKEKPASSIGRNYTTIDSRNQP